MITGNEDYLLILSQCFERRGSNLKLKCKCLFNINYYVLGLSIKCWECRSDSDPKCADPFDNSTLSITDCKQNAELEHLPGVKSTMCRKIRQKGFYLAKITLILVSCM